MFALLSYFDAHDDSTTTGEASIGAADAAAASAQLRAGNIVLAYSAAGDAAPLREIARAESGSARPGRPLIAAGQAVLVRRIAGTRGVVARAWHRSLHAQSGNDPAIEDFVSAYLGQGDG